MNRNHSTLTDPRRVWSARAGDVGLPLWLRVAAYAEAFARPNGHCPLEPDQLRTELDPTLRRDMISRAIGRAVDHGWLHSASSARCLILARSTAEQPGCPATHRLRRSG